VKLDYLFLDAGFFRMHSGSPAEPVLAAWGITTGGKPAFIGLGPGTGQPFDAWRDFLADLRDHGLSFPAGRRPGTSKLNKIEQRLFSHITLNWRGRPLTSHEVIDQSGGVSAAAASARC